MLTLPFCRLLTSILLLGWLISATSPPVDDEERPWVEKFLDYMTERGEDVGVQSQPDSTEELMKMIVKFCVESYERPPAKHEALASGAAASPPSAASSPAASSPAAPLTEGAAAKEEGEVAVSQEANPGQKEGDKSIKLSIRQIFSNYINAIVSHLTQC